MNVYTDPNGIVLAVGQPFHIAGGDSYPAQWLGMASPADLAASGITMTVVPNPPPGAPPPPPPTLQITSTSTPALNGGYPIDAETQQKVAGVAEYVMANSKFPDNLPAFPVADASGTVHEFPTAMQFMAFATALADCITALDLGKSFAPVTIP